MQQMIDQSITREMQIESLNI